MKLFVSICVLAAAFSTTSLADETDIIIDTRLGNDAAVKPGTLAPVPTQNPAQNLTGNVVIPASALTPQPVVCDAANVCYVKMTKEQTAKYKKGNTDASIIMKFHDN